MLDISGYLASVLSVSVPATNIAVPTIPATSVAYSFIQVNPMGYRPSKMPFGYDENDPRCIEFKARLRDTIETLIGEGYAHFISGGALGMDMFAAEAVLELKEKYPWIVLEMVSPFDAQAACWDEEYQMRHYRLFATADIVTATGHEYTKACMFRRNRYMVNNADLLLAAYDGQPGGTAMTCEYAREMGVPIRLIMPLSRAA